MIIKLATIKDFRVQNGNPADESSVPLCVAHCSPTVAVAALRSISRSGCYPLLYFVTTADSGGRWCDRRDTVAISFQFMILKKRVHCSPDQVTERVIFAAGLGFYLPTCLTK